MMSEKIRKKNKKKNTKEKQKEKGAPEQIIKRKSNSNNLVTPLSPWYNGSAPELEVKLSSF